ncbi:hypothetical protein Adu01nite_47380 [Paractinoplanes durhamensis]|uniref:Uncharacterized protein n=1 Tax=Paractinoplanes durhamensis TaxID=113563 RepID=A0ABQ3Z0N5_9ACTN|nr:hypothetical protein Adu01nite_47380 [Actinoplanes durhamensis]
MVAGLRRVASRKAITTGAILWTAGVEAIIARPRSAATASTARHDVGRTPARADEAIRQDGNRPAP